MNDEYDEEQYDIPFESDEVEQYREDCADRARDMREAV